MYRCVHGGLCLKWRFGGKRRDIHISHAYMQQALMLSSPRVNYRTRSHTPEIAPFILIEHCGNWLQPLCLLSVHCVGCVLLRVRVTLSVPLPHERQLWHALLNLCSSMVYCHTETKECVRVYWTCKPVSQCMQKKHVLFLPPILAGNSLVHVSSTVLHSTSIGVRFATESDLYQDHFCNIDYEQT